MNAAADDSLRRMPGEDCAPVRCVIVAVVPDGELSAASSDELITARVLDSGIGWELVDSIHIDNPDVSGLVEAAAHGDDEAFETLGEEDLMWFDVQERTALAASFAK